MSDIKIIETPNFIGDVDIGLIYNDETSNRLFQKRKIAPYVEDTDFFNFTLGKFFNFFAFTF